MELLSKAVYDRFHLF